MKKKANTSKAAGLLLAKLVSLNYDSQGARKLTCHLCFELCMFCCHFYELRAMSHVLLL